MFTPNYGKWGAINPLVGQNVKDAAVALQKIQAQLTAEGLSGVKNVRNAREFNTLGQAATAGLNAAASPDDFVKAISDLQNKFLDAQATNEPRGGPQVDGQPRRARRQRPSVRDAAERSAESLLQRRQRGRSAAEGRRSG